MRVTDAEVREAMDTYKAASEYGLYFGGDAKAWRAALNTFLAARTTARGEPYEPTEAEIEAAAEAIWGAIALPNRFNPPLRWSDKTAPEQERYRTCARAAFYAARNAGEEDADENGT